MKLFKRSKNYGWLAVLIIVILFIGFISLDKYAEKQESLRLAYEEVMALNETGLSRNCGLFKWKRFCPEYCNWDSSNKNQKCGMDLSALNAAQSSYEDYLVYLVEKGAITPDDIIRNESIEVVNAIAQKNPENLKYVSDESILIEAVRSNPINIQYIQNPSETVQLIGIQENGCILEYIDNPSDAILREGIKNCSTALTFLKNPTDELIRLAIEYHPEAVEYLENIEADLLKLALSKGYAPQAVEEMGMEANRIYFSILKKMAPSLSRDELATAGSGRYTPNLQKKSKEVIKEELVKLAVKRNISIINEASILFPELLEEKEKIKRVIDEPEAVLAELGKPYDEDKIMEYLFINPYLIRYIDNPTEEMQIFAGLLDLNVLQYVENLTDKVSVFTYDHLYCDEKYGNQPNEEDWVDMFIAFSRNMPKNEILKLLKEYGVRVSFDYGVYGEDLWEIQGSVQRNRVEYLQCEFGDITPHFKWLNAMY